MRVTFFGVRGSCPCSGPGFERYGGNTSCVLVEVGGQPDAGGAPANGRSRGSAGKGDPALIILDLGTGLRRLGEHLDGLDLFGKGERKVRPISASAFVTHLHWDHIQGLPFFPQADRTDTEIDIYGPEQARETIHEAYERFMAHPFFPVGVFDLKATIRLHGLLPGARTAVGTAVVTAENVPHPGGLTLGYRVEAHGHSLAYVSDHQAPPGWADGEVSPEILDLCAGVDLLIHDAQFSPEEFEDKYDWGHATVDYAVTVAGRAGARRLLLFHHDPAHRDDDIDALVGRARRLAGASAVDVVAAYEGLSIDLDDEKAAQPPTAPALHA